MIPTNLVYLVGCIPFAIVWSLFYFWRKDLRREMLYTGTFIGILSVWTAYYWWTKDWWHPQTITGTRVGIEDLILGFFSGGIMAVAYEVIFSRQLYRVKAKPHHIGALAILLFLAYMMSWLFWGIGLTSFYASSIAMILAIAVIFWNRSDLWKDALMSGVLMAVISTSFYASVAYASPTWIQHTYDFGHLSGILILGVPIEEFVFWFLSGVLFGPLYEYALSDGLRRSARRR